MKAAIMRDRTMVVDEIPAPVPGIGEVLVKTLACGICGSDLHMLKHADLFSTENGDPDNPFLMDLNRDVVMGHEFCAEILEFGPQTAQQLSVGARVCSMPILLRQDGMQSIGYSNEAPGGYGEQMILSEAFLLEVPDNLTSSHAALTEPMSVGLHAVAMSQIQEGEVPLVIGCGPVGLAVIEALRLKGISPIIAVDYSAGRRELATAMGASVVIDAAEQSPYTCWQELAATDASDEAAGLLGMALKPGVFFECVGVPGVIDQMMEGAARGCRIVVVGVCMQEDVFRPIQGINKELSMQFVLGYTPDEFTQTLNLIASGEMNVTPMVTGSIGVDGVPAAFEELTRPARQAKIIVEPWRS